MGLGFTGYHNYPPNPVLVIQTSLARAPDLINPTCLEIACLRLASLHAAAAGDAWVSVRFAMP